MSATRIPILLLSRTLGIGGCERDVTKLALALNGGRYEPHIGCFFDDGWRVNELRSAGIPVTCFPVRSFKSVSTLSQAVRLRRYCGQNGIQLIHSFDPTTNIFAAPVARAAGLRGVISSNLWYRDLLDRRSLILSRLADSLVDRIVVNSAAVQTHLIESEKIPRSLTFLSPNGVDPRAFHSAGRTRLPAVDSASLVIGTVCALREEKRVDLLLDGFAAVRSLAPRMKLLIAGSGVMLGSLREQAKALGIDDVTVFQPSESDTAPFFRSIDVFVLTSRSESFPNTVLEAMACGCCVLSSRVGGVPEAIVEGENGMMFRPCDLEDLRRVLSRAVLEPEIRKRLAAAAALDAPRLFSMEAVLRRMEGLYDSVLTDHAVR